MKKALFTLLFVALLASAAAAQAGIDFTLGSRPAGEGAPDPENRFITDGDSHIYLRIPMGWRAEGSAGKLDLLPAQASSHVQVGQIGGVQALPLDPAGLEVLRKQAQAALPEGAKAITKVGEVNDLLPVFGWKSFEITFDYEFYGQQLRHSTLFINMIPGRVVRVSVSALTSNFDDVHEKTRKLMFGWFEPKRDLSPEQAQQYENGEFKGG